MKQAELKDVMEWIKTTDLVAVRYHDGSSGFDLALAEPAAAPLPVSCASRYLPVCAPAVGVFQPHAPGQPRRGGAGLAVKEGDVLGQVETGSGKPHEVPSPCAGRVARVFVSDGQAVEYGQPLFFLERD